MSNGSNFFLNYGISATTDSEINERKERLDNFSKSKGSFVIVQNWTLLTNPADFTITTLAKDEVSTLGININTKYNRYYICIEAEHPSVDLLKIQKEFISPRRLPTIDNNIDTLGNWYLIDSETKYAAASIGGTIFFSMEGLRGPDIFLIATSKFDATPNNFDFTTTTPTVKIWGGNSW